MKFLPFLKKNKVLQLTEELREVLLSKFGIQSDVADDLRFVTKRGKYAGQSVRLVCIFNKARVQVSELASCTYDKMMSNKGDLLYAGHIGRVGSFETKGSSVYLQDLAAS
jgi:hypothetical protein